MKPILILRMRQEPAGGGSFDTITFVGSKTFSHNQTSAQSCSLTDLLDEAGNSATLAEDDVVFINLAVGTNVNMTQAALTPTDYTTAHTDLYANDSADCNQQVSYRVMGASPDTSASIPASPSTAQSVTVSIMALRGVDTSSPLDVAATTATGINGGVSDPAAITPSTAGAWILACAASASTDGVAFTNSGDLSSTANHFPSAIHTGAAGNKAASAIGVKTDWASGAFDPAAFGGSSASATASWSAVTLAIKPGPA